MLLSPTIEVPSNFHALSLRDQRQLLVDMGAYHQSTDQTHHILRRDAHSWSVVTFITIEGLDDFSRTVALISWAAVRSLNVVRASNGDQILANDQRGMPVMINGLDDAMVTEYKLRWF